MTKHTSCDCRYSYSAPRMYSASQCHDPKKGPIGDMVETEVLHQRIETLSQHLEGVMKMTKILLAVDVHQHSIKA